jgi:hypothetical protein
VTPLNKYELAWKTVIDLISDRAKAVIAKSNGVWGGGDERRLSLVCNVLFITHCMQNFEDDSYNGHCWKTVHFIQASSHKQL